MITRRTLAAAAAAPLLAASLVAAPALAQAPAAPKPNPQVKLTTPEGAILIELFVDKAPITARNFLRYVDSHRFDGATFYRASTPKGDETKATGVVQGGLQNDPKKVYPPIAHESTLKTGLKHTDGTLSMGRHAPGTAQSDFFICVGDQPYLDADPNDPKNPGFAAFARVVEGMDVVKAMLKRATDPNKGAGVMKGEYFRTPVVIQSARRLATPIAPAAAPAPATPPTQP